MTTGERLEVRDVWSLRSVSGEHPYFGYHFLLLFYISSLTYFSFQDNAFFQSSAIQGRILRNQNIALKKEKNRFEKELKKWESGALVAEDQATFYHEKYINIHKKQNMKFQTLVDIYQKSDTFI